MKNVKFFYGSYIAIMLFILLGVSNMAAGVADWFPGILVIIAMSVYLLFNLKKFKRAIAIVKKKTPEPDDAPMNLEV